MKAVLPVACLAFIGERMSHVTDLVKQLALDVAELHDVHQQRQHGRKRVPAEQHAGRTASVKRSPTVHQAGSTSRQL